MNFISTLLVFFTGTGVWYATKNFPLSWAVITGLQALIFAIESVAERVEKALSKKRTGR